MQYSVAMQRSCTRGPRELFPLNKVEEEEKEQEVKEEENKKEEDKRRKSKRRMRRSQLQCSPPQQCSRVALVGQGNCFQ